MRSSISHLLPREGELKPTSWVLAALQQNLVAFCDVDEVRASKAYKAYQKAPKFRDFRKMLDTVKGIDAVVISTPDHMHGPATLAAMKLGKHVYCEKPLAHSLYETKVLRDTAAQGKLATQMGNLGTGSSEFRKELK